MRLEQQEDVSEVAKVSLGEFLLLMINDLFRDLFRGLQSNIAQDSTELPVASETKTLVLEFELCGKGFE